MGDMNWKEDGYDVDVGIATAIRNIGVNTLVEFAIRPDTVNTSRNIIVLLPAQAMHIKFDSDKTKSTLKKIAGNSSNFDNDIKDLVSLQNELVKIIMTTFPSSEEVYKQYKIKDFQNIIKGVDLIQFFQVITNSSLNAINEFLTDEDVIGIADVPYFQNLAELIQSNNYTLRTYANYIGAVIVMQITSVVQTVIGIPGYSYPRQSLIYSSPTDDWVPCMNILRQKLNYVVDRIYIDYLGENSKLDNERKELIDFIRNAFETLANESDWLDKKTLSATLQKLHAMRQNHGYASWILNDEELDNYYSMLPDMESDFAANIKNIAEFVTKQKLMMLREKNNLNEWPNLPGLSTTMANAFYVTSYNSINFPLAVQNPPLYDPDTPWYLNFGATGAIIGHEVTHGFDSTGRLLDKNGNKYNWWSKNAEEQFNKRAQCFVHHYDKYFDHSTNQYVDGTQTLTENIADNGGLREAYLAYQMWEKKYGKELPLPGLEKYTPYQLFFISFGNMWCASNDASAMENLMKDVHTPSPYRTLGTISNSKEFADTFNCAEGTEMNPKEKCIIW